MWFPHCIEARREKNSALPNEQTIKRLKAERKKWREKNCIRWQNKKRKRTAPPSKIDSGMGHTFFITCKLNIDWGFCFIDVMDFIRKQSAPFKIKWFFLSFFRFVSPPPSPSPSLHFFFVIESFPLLFFISFSLLLVLSSVLWFFVFPSHSKAF